jgi:hypothetical protein
MRCCMMIKDQCDSKLGSCVKRYEEAKGGQTTNFMFFCHLFGHGHFLLVIVARVLHGYVEI